MKRIISLISVIILVFLLSACSGIIENENVASSKTSALDPMIELDSYYAIMSVSSVSLDINARRHYLKDGDFMMLKYSDQDIVYSFGEDENKIILWMGPDDVEFEISSEDIVQVFDFNYIKSLDLTDLGGGRYSVDTDFGNLEDFKFNIENELVTTMSFYVTTEIYYRLRCEITFSDYDNIAFSYQNQPISPTNLQLELYKFYEKGYILKVTTSTVSLCGLDHTISFGLDSETIKIYVEDGYLEIYPTTRKIGVVSLYMNIAYSYDDFFRLYTELIFTKEEVNDIIDIYNLFIQ